MKNLKYLIAALSLFVFTITVFGQSKDPRDEAIQQARAGIDALDTWYNKDRAIWFGESKEFPIWWNSANAVTAIVRYGKFTGSKQYVSLVKSIFDKNKGGNFLNEFYDDEGWWGLAWVEAYEFNKNAEYLRVAQTIFKDMADGWSSDFGGGVWWKKDKKVKNAIENHLFMLLALRLHEHRPNTKIEGKSYLQWAEMTWDWYANKAKLLQSDGRIADGLHADGKINNIYFTYNQGVAMATAIEFYKVKKDQKYLSLAEKIARATIKTMTNKDGILEEWCGMNGDTAQFKGVFMRHLYTLYELTGRTSYKNFILKNAESIWKNREPKNNLFGDSWSKPYQKTDHDFSSHSSALDCMVSAIGVLNKFKGVELQETSEEE